MQRADVNHSKKIAVDLHTFARLMPAMLQGHWRHAAMLFAVVLFASIMEGIGFSLVIPLVQTMLSHTAEVTGGGILQRAFGQITAIMPSDWHLGGLIGLLLLVFLIKSLGSIAASGMARWFVDTLRMEWIVSVFLSYMRKAYSPVVIRPHGEVVQNIIGETELAARAALLLIEFAARCIQIFVLIILLFLASWQTTLFVLFLAALGFGLSWRSTQLLSLDAGRTRQIIRRQSNDIVSEGITGLRTIKLLDIAVGRAKRLRKMLRDFRRVDTKFEAVSALPNNTIDLVAIVVGAAVIFFMTMALGLRIEEALPTTALFGLVFLRLATSASYLFSKRLQIVTSLPPLRSVFETMTSAPEQASGSASFPGIIGDIVFEDLALKPPGREAIFDGLRMTIPSVGLTAIVGPSGSGKTTLVDLIVRLREPDGGRILIAGRDIREFDVRSLRARVGYLSQEPQLFNGTVAENLRLGRPDASEAEVRDAARRAHVDDFVSAMPKGYDTPLGRGAVTLSGGQRQRLALARELLRNPDLYIFDEPTSALDQEAEAVIGELVNELSKTHPVVIISHRPDVIFGANVIYRIEQGKAVELDLPELVKAPASVAAP
jgi:ABC-type multidrug transport system fused ATPase/permease subunit